MVFIRLRPNVDLHFSGAASHGAQNKNAFD